MNDASVIKAAYADWRTIKTRKTLQLIFEVPLEAQTEVLGLLGAPMPDRDLWVAIAPLRAAKPDTPVQERPKGGLAQQAGILCADPAFRRFLAERQQIDGVAICDTDLAADIVRDLCGVKSRAELANNIDAARKFRDLRSDFRNWQHGVAA